MTTSDLMLIAAVLLVCAIVGALIAPRKGYRPIDGAVFGAVLGPIGVLVLAVMGDKRQIQ